MNPLVSYVPPTSSSACNYIGHNQAYVEVSLGAEIRNSTLQFLQEVNPASGQFRVVMPIEQTMHVCRNELELAQFNVTQLGQRRLLGCKPGDSTSFIELTLERSSPSSTDVVCVMHG